ncbi:MAG: hypothetical protein QGH45_07750 [Myxococcota bacterium]|jgi:hypothetical protein|nr:hypothetical protein [Myxococcota bacterium]
MFQRLILLSLLALPLLLWGCPVDDDDDASGDDDTGDDDTGDDDTGDDDTGDDDTTPPVEPYLTGHVYDVTCTDPVAGVRVTFCQVACTFKDTDSDGKFIFGGLASEPGLFDVIGHVNPEGKYYTGIAWTIDIPDSGFVEAPTTCLPEVESLVDVPSGTNDVSVGDDLILTVNPDEVEWLLGEPELGAVEVPDTAWQYVDLEGVDMLGVWALYAWGNVLSEDAADPVGISLPVRGDLDTGDPVTIYGMSHDEGGFHEIASATVTGGDLRVVTDSGQGLTEFTWIAYGVPE